MYIVLLQIIEYKMFRRLFTNIFFLLLSVPNVEFL